MSTPLAGRRILVTQATEFMGPALCRILAAQGAHVIADAEALTAPEAAERVVRSAGPIDVLVANLAFHAERPLAASR